MKPMHIMIAVVVLVVAYMAWCKLKKMPLGKQYREFFQDAREDPDPEDGSLGQQQQLPATHSVASDLLPKPQPVTDAKVTGFDLAPKDLQDINFMQIVGVDTVNASMKNANLQIRADPCITRKNVSPWLNSTIECDLLRKPLE